MIASYKCKEAHAIVKGTRAITADPVLCLRGFFGTGPEFRIDLQSNSELCIAVAEFQKEIRTIPKLELA